MLWADLVNLKGTKKSARAWAAILNLLNHRRTCGLTESDSGFPLERRGVHRNAARRSISGTVGVGRSLEQTVPISPFDRPGCRSRSDPTRTARRFRDCRSFRDRPLVELSRVGNPAGTHLAVGEVPRRIHPPIPCRTAESGERLPYRSVFPSSNW